MISSYFLIWTACIFNRASSQVIWSFVGPDFVNLDSARGKTNLTREKCVSKSAQLSSSLE